MSYPSLPTSKLFQLTALTLSLALAGCGGGGGGDTVDSIAPKPGGTGSTDGTGENPDGSSANASEVYISAEKNQLLTGSDKTTVNIRVTDKNGGIVSNTPVSINITDAALYGLSLSGASSQITDDQGLVAVELLQSTVGIDSQLNHESILTVTINANSNIIKQNLPILVSGTSTSNVVSSKNVVEAGENFSVSGQILDGTAKPVANANVVLYSNDKEAITGTTDNNGKFIFDLNASNLEASDVGYLFSIEVRGEKVSQRIPDILSVAAASSSTMSFSQTTDIVVGDKQKITLNVPDSVNGDIVYVSTNKGKVLASLNDTQSSSRKALTVVNKKIDFYIDSNVPGTATIRAENGTDAKEVSLDFVSIEPTKLLLQIERAVLGASGSTSVIARVLDKNDAPVKNAIVQFTTTKDASGGSLGQGVAYTDDSGRAKVTYNAGKNPTSTNGVIIEAQVQSIKLPNGQEKAVNTLIDSSAITVQTKSSYISFAFADKVSVDSSEIYYFRKGSVSVLNSSGKPAINQPVSINLIPDSYLKGEFIVDRERFEDDDVIWNWYRVWKQKAVTCENEDKNNNSILDIGEDFNGNGLLDPVNVTAVLNKDGQLVDSSQDFNFITDDSGRVDFSIRYAKQYANWYRANVTVNTRVDGSESQQSRMIDFPALVDDISSPTADNLRRPNTKSPFGTDLSCSSSK
ncbi:MULTISPECIES: carboxypeptidase-like regulatory domain-containing protein [unclassified Psychrobacter]|uniref:carboxypeptidase-like regulatory domain-containing protein n=1 Tax=unclassified Psychrobacter TaxID=196806 RepID=UPI0025B42363|nr:MULTISPECIES: carboxypeptidase-like regulatory domain-containing protein [unclassified Psychrobacter]MDN3452509.1 carboxypeptidase-like regulatory domain-containing protein [Psychrobacter sp. APC 3350]MDN3502351.1 carboxypeptidase-like regulatory domain-containing protein [Psychrobacter sp. 5A.1]